MKRSQEIIPGNPEYIDYKDGKKPYKQSAEDRPGFFTNAQFEAWMEQMRSDFDMLINSDDETEPNS